MNSKFTNGMFSKVSDVDIKSISWPHSVTIFGEKSITSNLLRDIIKNNHKDYDQIILFSDDDKLLIDEPEIFKKLVTISLDENNLEDVLSRIVYSQRTLNEFRVEKYKRLVVFDHVVNKELLKSQGVEYLACNGRCLRVNFIMINEKVKDVSRLVMLNSNYQFQVK